MPETPDLAALARLFYPDGAKLPSMQLGTFERAAAEALPADYRELLAHNSHMTVAMEKFHDSPVDVEVLDRRTDDKHYSRKIRLRSRRSKKVVQFGIVRLNLEYLEPNVREIVLSEKTPLGRVLIDHGVLMQVRLTTLWRIMPGPDLVKSLELAQPTTIYGRTAMIDFEAQPAIELLEISGPLE